MTKNNKVFELTQEELDVIATYMIGIQEKCSSQVVVY